MKKIAVALLLAVLVFMPVFAEGTIEEAKTSGYAEGYEAGKAVDKYQLNKQITGQTRPEVIGKAVATAGSPLTAMAGYNVLRAGGNAFDAAFAMAAMQAFSEAPMTNIIGGDAEIIVWDNTEKKMTVYNGTGWAPENQTVEFYLDKTGSIPSKGIYSMQMPGEWSGWMKLMHDKGSRSMQENLQEVIDVVTEGTLADAYLEYFIAQAARSPQNLNDAAKAILQNPDGSWKKIGDSYKNPDYGKTLQMFCDVAAKADNFRDGYTLADEYFYRGPFAELLVKWNNENEGVWTLRDFNEYTAQVQEPIHTNYKGYEVYACPPNSQGAALLEALNIVENYDLSKFEHNSAEYISLVAQIFNIALNDRNHFIIDPRFGTMPEEIITKEYAKKMMKYIDPSKAWTEIPLDMDLALGNPAYEDSDTTFMAVADEQGNVVAVVHSILSFWGSGMVVDGTGVWMNDRMTYYMLDDEQANVLAPHKRTMQTITPFIALKDGQPAFFVGTPGADQQTQTSFQVLMNYLEFGFSVQGAVDQPRSITNHPKSASGTSLNPGKLTVMAVGDETIAKLTEMGYKVSKSTNTGSVGFGVFKDGFWMVGEDPTRDAYTYGF